MSKERVHDVVVRLATRSVPIRICAQGLAPPAVGRSTPALCAHQRGSSATLRPFGDTVPPMAKRSTTAGTFGHRWPAIPRGRFPVSLDRVRRGTETDRDRNPYCGGPLARVPEHRPIQSRPVTEARTEHRLFHACGSGRCGGPNPVRRCRRRRQAPGPTAMAETDR